MKETKITVLLLIYILTAFSIIGCNSAPVMKIDGDTEINDSATGGLIIDDSDINDITILDIDGVEETPADEERYETETDVDEVDEEEEQNFSEEPDNEAEVIVHYDTGIEMSDDIWDFTVKIDGMTYKLPSKLDDFKNSGWTYTYNNNPENENVYGEDIKASHMENENGSIMITVINMSGNTKRFGDCKIGGIEVSFNRFPNHTVELSNGLEITSETTKQDIIEKWGEPDTNHDIRITYSLDTYNLYTFMFEETGKIMSIDIDNYVVDESDNTENGERPAYLDKYVAPTVLSDDVFSFMFGFDGYLYALPVPVSEFVNNGWSPAESIDSVASKQTVVGGLRMVKGDAEIRLDIRNYEDYQVSPTDCMVTRIYVTDDPYHDNKGFIMAGGITFGMTEQEFFSIIDENGFDKTEYSTSKQYEYDFGNEYWFKSFSVSFNKEGKLDKINYEYSPREY